MPSARSFGCRIGKPTALLHSRFWSAGPQNMPGWVTYPDYPSSWREGKLKIAGLQHYHDHIYWSWLVALSAKVAAVMGDKPEAERIIEGYRQLLVRDKAVAEIYRWQPGLPPFRSWLYKSEAPFSWGAGFTVDMIQAVRR